jgi:hypothetical protein
MRSGAVEEGSSEGIAGVIEAGTVVVVVGMGGIVAGEGFGIVDTLIYQG